MLSSLRDKTTIGKDIVEDEDEFAILKCTLLESIETAKGVRSLSLFQHVQVSLRGPPKLKQIVFPWCIKTE